MFRSVFLSVLLIPGFSLTLLGQLAYHGPVVDPYEGTIHVSISTNAHDSWDVRGDVELGKMAWGDFFEETEVSLFKADAQSTMEMLAELEELEQQDLQLASFSAGRETNHVFLEWSDATRDEILRFFIQRSSDGMSWEDIGMLSIPQSSMPLEDYSYIDNHPFASSNFYRLKQEGKTGKVSYSEVVAVEMLASGSHTTHLFPNPAIFGATIDLNLKEVLPVYISLLNAEDQTIATIFSDQTSIGRHTVELNLDELPKGQYSCLIEVGNQTSERILVK